jgi:hypothetical protein
MACCCQKWVYTVLGDAVVAFYPSKKRGSWAWHIKLFIYEIKMLCVVFAFLTKNTVSRMDNTVYEVLFLVKKITIQKYWSVFT